MRDRIAGLVLMEGEGFDGKPIVAIATFSTANRKTGNMAQVWILAQWYEPGYAVAHKLDRTVCGNCPYAGGDGCYVNPWTAPDAVWHMWKRNGYPVWDGSTRYFRKRLIRWGAYGEPVLIPATIVGKLSSACEGWTGYTHAWKTHPQYREWFMASVGSPSEAEIAHAAGWRTYRVRAEGTPLLANEVACPGSAERDYALTCDECLLCNGGNRATSVAIQPHGIRSGRIALPLV